MFENGYRPKWGRQGWIAVSTIIVIGIGTVTVGRTNDTRTILPARFQKLSRKMAPLHTPMRTRTNAHPAPT